MIHIICYWCKRDLREEPARGALNVEQLKQLHKRCACVGYGRHRFHAKVWFARFAARIRRCAA